MKKYLPYVLGAICFATFAYTAVLTMEYFKDPSPYRGVRALIWFGFFIWDVWSIVDRVNRKGAGI